MMVTITIWFRKTNPDWNIEWKKKNKTGNLKPRIRLLRRTEAVGLDRALLDHWEFATPDPWDPA